VTEPESCCAVVMLVCVYILCLKQECSYDAVDWTVDPENLVSFFHQDEWELVKAEDLGGGTKMFLLIFVSLLRSSYLIFI